MEKRVIIYPCRSPSLRSTAPSPQTVAGLLTKHQSRAAARSLLDAGTESLPAFWAELGGLGWLGLHVPEELGGSGFGLPETLVVVEELGRHLAPGPFVPTVIASAVLAAAGPDELRKRLLPGLADGSVIGAVALGGEVTVRRRHRHRARPASCSAAAWPTCCWSRPATTCW